MMNIETLHVPYLGQYTNCYTFVTKHYRVLIDTALKATSQMYCHCWATEGKTLCC